MLGRRLCSCTLIAIVFGGCGGNLSLSSQTEACIPQVRAIAQMLTPNQYLSDAGMVPTASGFFLAGTGVGYGETAEVPKMVVLDSLRGFLPPPPRHSRYNPAFTQPVVLEDSTVGVMWAEPIPPDTTQPWIESSYTRLFLARRKANSWSSPELVLRTRFKTSWGGGAARSTPRGPTLISLIAAESPNERAALFGTPTVLDTVPLPDGLVPIAVAHDLDISGRITLSVFAFPKVPKDKQAYFILMSKRDMKSAWSAPETIGAMSEGAVSNFRVVQDRSRRVHLIWLGQDDHIRHVVSGTNGWVRSDPPNAPAVLDWVAGVNQCGRFTVVRSALKSDETVHFEISEWNDSFPAFRSFAPAFDGLALFDGYDAAGWFVGWSGGSKGSNDQRLSIFIAHP